MNQRIPAYEDEVRTATIAGLRALADYWEAHPDLPVPLLGVDLTFYPQGDDEAKRRQVDEISALLGVEPLTEVRNGHYVCRRGFGGAVTYEAIVVPAQVMARYNARHSYTDSVDTDGVA